MKILYVLNDTLHHAGTESVILNYYNHIDKDTIHIDFLLNAPKSELTDNDICKYLLEKGSKVFCITPRREDSNANKKEFHNILKEEQYDIVHTHTDAVGSYFLKLAKDAGVKVRIAHSHNTRHQLEKTSIKNRVHFAYLEKCRKDIRKVATHYMACSKEAGEWLFGKENKDKVYILNNAIDTEKFKFDKEARDRIRKELGIKEDEILLGHIGRFKPQKNHTFLIEAFKEICEEKDNYKLLLVGDGPLLEDIKKKTDEYKLLDKVIFYGVADKTSEILNAMDAFLFPSIHEGLSVVMIEAQCNGLKCFMSDTPDVSKDTIITKDRVKTLKIDDPKTWAKEVEASDLKRKDEREDIEENGYNIVPEAKKLEDYYSSLIQRN